MKKEKTFYIERANAILSRLDTYLNNRYSNNLGYALNDVMSETELLFYGYAKDYPALHDLRAIKERYQGREHNFDTVIVKAIKLSLERFIDFQENHNLVLEEN